MLTKMGALEQTARNGPSACVLHACVPQHEFIVALRKELANWAPGDTDIFIHEAKLAKFVPQRVCAARKARSHGEEDATE